MKITANTMAIAQLVGAVSAQIQTYDGGPSFDFAYVGDDKFEISASVPENTYLGIGYGTSMHFVDMVYIGPIGEGLVWDLYGITDEGPERDDQQDYTVKSVDTSSTAGVYKFVIERAMKTGDFWEINNSLVERTTLSLGQAATKMQT